MFKAIPSLLVGTVIGAGLVWGALHRPTPSTPVAVLPKRDPACDVRDLQRAQERVAHLESELRKVTRAPEPTPAVAQEPVGEESLQTQADESLTWKVSAIEKFVPLSDEQRERLRVKFAKEREGAEEGEVESLDAILGGESAAFYRERVQAAFKKVHDEEVEREVVWLSRKLSLSPAQESSVQSILSSVEAEVAQGRNHGSSGATPQERVKNMIADNRRRTELRNERLKIVLTPEQFATYLQSEAESSSADVEVFHDAEAK
jgi:hypothetical protein